MIHLGDCVTVMAGMPGDSVDAVVTDPPYGLPGGFMGKSWDRFAGHEDAGFAYWLAGLIDGEGHFAIKKHSRGTHAPFFQLKMRADEEGTLRAIERRLRIGTINQEEHDPNPLVKWTVQDKEGCQRLVDLLDKYPLRAKKRLDYGIWRDAVCEWTDRPRGNRWHGGTDNSRMAGLRERIMAVRKYTEPAWSGHEYQDWSRLWGIEAIRVLKPGGWLLAFGGSRAYHRMVAGIEDAGFEIRDTLQHIYASGFPKGKANLKPAHEPIVLARKPGPLRPLGIDDCRISMPAGETLIAPSATGAVVGGHQGQAGYDRPWKHDPEAVQRRVERAEAAIETANTLGRWPSNLLLSDPELFDEPNPYVVGSGATASTGGQPTDERGTGGIWHEGNGVPAGPQYGDTGGYSRYFIVPKSSRSDREPVIVPDGHDRSKRFSTHPTQKPTDLMAHLIRLVCPPDGVILDPFLGSGSTAVAAEREGVKWIGIEQSSEYVAIAEARLNGTQRGLGLDVAAPTRKRTWIPGANEDGKPRKGYPGAGQWGQWATELAKPSDEPL